MLHRLFLLLVFLFPLVSHTQIDQKKLDSLRRSIDSSAAAHKLWQDSVAKVQDSLYKIAIRKTVGSEKSSEDHRKKAVERQRSLQGILIVLAIVIAVIIVLLRRKTKRT